MNEIIQIVLMLLSLIMPPKPVHQEPQGWLDCAFTEQNVYQCRP